MDVCSLTYTRPQCQNPCIVLGEKTVTTRREQRRQSEVFSFKLVQLTRYLCRGIRVCMMSLGRPNQLPEPSRVPPVADLLDETLGYDVVRY